MCQDVRQKFSNFVFFWGGGEKTCFQHPRFTGFCAHFYNTNFVMEQEVLRRWCSSVSIVTRLWSVHGLGFDSAAPCCSSVDIYERVNENSGSIKKNFIWSAKKKILYL